MIHSGPDRTLQFAEVAADKARTAQDGEPVEIAGKRIGVALHRPEHRVILRLVVVASWVGALTVWLAAMNREATLRQVLSLRASPCNRNKAGFCPPVWTRC